MATYAGNYSAFERQRAKPGRLDEEFLRWQFTVSRTKQLDFLDTLLRLMTDGIPFSQACEYNREVGSPVHRVVAERMLRRLDEGATAVDTMVSLFSLDIVRAFAAAQQSGDLAETGMSTLERLRTQHLARRGVAAQLLKPTLYVIFSLALYAGFALEIWPRFEVAAAKEQWPAVAQYAYQVGQAIASWWLVALVSLLSAAVALRLLLRRYAGPGRKLLDRIWPFSVYRDLLAANSLEEIGTLLTAGREPSVVLETVSTYATPYVRFYLEQMKRRLDEGHNLAEVLDVDFLSDRHIVRLKLLAGYRNLRQTMALTGAAARDATLAHVRRTARALDVAGIGFTGLAFAALIVSVYLTGTVISTELAS